MNRAVLDKVVEITADQHDVEKSSISPETHFFDDLDDSLDYIMIIMTCEEEFGVRISQEEFTSHRLETVGKLASFISDKLNNRTP